MRAPASPLRRTAESASCSVNVARSASQRREARLSNAHHLWIGAVVVALVSGSCTGKRPPNRVGSNDGIVGHIVDDATLDTLLKDVLPANRDPSSDERALHNRAVVAILKNLFGYVANTELPDAFEYFARGGLPSIPTLSYRNETVRVLDQEPVFWGVALADRYQPSEKDPYGRELSGPDGCPYVSFRLTTLGETRPAPVLSITDLLRTALPADTHAVTAAPSQTQVVPSHPVSPASKYCWVVQIFNLQKDSFDRFIITAPSPKPPDPDSSSSEGKTSGNHSQKGASNDASKASGCRCSEGNSHGATAPPETAPPSLICDGLQPSCCFSASDIAWPAAPMDCPGPFSPNYEAPPDVVLNFANTSAPPYGLSVAIGSDLASYRNKNNSTWCWHEGGCVPSLYVFAHLFSWQTGDPTLNAQPIATWAVVLGARVLDPALSEVVFGGRVGFGEGARGALPRFGLVSGLGYGLPSFTNNTRSGGDWRWFVGLDYAF